MLLLRQCSGYRKVIARARKKRNISVKTVRICLRGLSAASCGGSMHHPKIPLLSKNIARYIQKIAYNIPFLNSSSERQPGLQRIWRTEFSIGSIHGRGLSVLLIHLSGAEISPSSCALHFRVFLISFFAVFLWQYFRLKQPLENSKECNFGCMGIWLVSLF